MDYSFADAGCRATGRGPAVARHPTAVLLLGLTLLAGCVPPKVIQYTSFHDRGFSERRTPAAVQTTPAAELLSGGYLLIGYIDLRRNVRTCYEDNQCIDHSDATPSREDLQREAAERGGDVLTLLEDRTVIEPNNKSVCTGTTASVTMVNNVPQVTTTCVAYRTIAGKLEARISRALIWRHDPEAARGEANARAMDAALKTLESTYRADQRKTATPAAAAVAGQLPGQAKGGEASDELGRQILLGIRTNDSQLLYRLARNGQLQNWKDEAGRSALMVAIMAEQFDAAQTLLAIDRGLERRDNNGLNAMHYGVARADLAFVRKLAAAGYDLRQKAGQRTSLLYFSLWNPRTEVFEWLVSQGLDPKERADQNETALIAAAGAGNEPLVRRLLQLGVDVNLVTDDGFTALMRAAAKGQTAVVPVLLKAGARTDLRDKLGNNALHYAAVGGKTETLQLLLQHRMDINAVNDKGGSPLVMAMASEKWDAARYLMDRGVRLTTDKLSAEDTAQFLISKNQPQLLQRYLAAYAQLNEQVQRDPDWLQYAAKTSGRETIRLMVERGAHINRVGTDGLTPLMTASSAGNDTTVRALLELKADPTLRDRRGQTALKKASLMGHAKVIEALREFGVRE